MDSRRSGNNDTGCGDDEALQRLVDGELHDSDEELWLHHVATCSSCASRVSELRELRDWCAGRLGIEDEGAEWQRDAAVTRVKARLDAIVRPPARHHPWRWLAAAAAAGFVFLALVLPLNPTPVGASAERVLRETIIRERAWMDQPGKVVRWTIEHTMSNNPRNPDGHYHSVSWKYNIAPGKTTRLLKRFDAAGRLVWARSAPEDGSEVVYDGRTRTATIQPSLAQLHHDAAALEPALREVLESWIADVSRNSETASYVDLFAGAPSQSAPTIDFLYLDGVGEVYRLRWGYGNGRASAQQADTRETYITRDGFRLLRQENTHTYPDGRVQEDLSEWTDYRIVPLDEFHAESLDSLVKSAQHIVRVTAAQIATRERARLAVQPAKR